MSDTTDERGLLDAPKMLTEPKTMTDKVMMHVFTAILTIFLVGVFMSFLWPLLQWLEAR